MSVQVLYDTYIKSDIFKNVYIADLQLKIKWQYRIILHLISPNEIYEVSYYPVSKTFPKGKIIAKARSIKYSHLNLTRELYEGDSSLESIHYLNNIIFNNFIEVY
jgi:hypothetical protein